MKPEGQEEEIADGITKSRSEFEQTPGDSEGQGSLACCSPWGCKESDMMEQLNNNNWFQNLFKVRTVTTHLRIHPICKNYFVFFNLANHNQVENSLEIYINTYHCNYCIYQ